MSRIKTVEMNVSCHKKIVFILFPFSFFSVESLISGVAGYEEDDGEDEDGPCEDIEDSSDDYDEDEDEAYDQSEEEKEEDTFTEEPDVLQDRKQFPSKPPKIIYQSPSAYSPEEEGILTPNVSVTPDFVHDEICATNDPILKMSIESPRGASKNKSYSIDRIISERLTPKSRKSAVRSPNKKDKTFTYSPMKKVETKPSITSKLRLHYESKENDSGSLNRTPVYHSPARTFMSVSPFARSKVLDEITKENFNSLFDDTRSRRSNSVSTDSTSTISSPYKLQNSKPKSARNLYGDYRSRRDQADSFYSSSRDSSHRTLERMDSSEDEGDDFGPRLSLDHTSSDLVTRLDRVRVTDCSRSERRPQSPSCRTPSRARVNFRRHPPSNYHDYRKYADELEDAEEVDTGHYRPSGDTFKVRDVMWDCQKLPTPKKRPPLMTSMSPRRHRKPSEDVLVTSVLVCSRCKRMSNLPEVYWKCRDVAFLCDDCLVSVSGHVDCDVDMCAVCMLAAEEIRRRMVVAENFLKGNLVLEET